MAADARQALFDLLEAAAHDQVFPGCVALVWRDGTFLYHEAHGVLATHRRLPQWGRATARDTVYDLASLSKVLATTTLCAQAITEGRIELDEPVPEAFARACPGATLVDLLEHCAGLVAHEEYFTRVAPFDAAAVLDQVAASRPGYPLRSQTVYSDLGFMILGAWIPALWGQDLLDAFVDRVSYRLGLRSGEVPPLAFRPLAHDPRRGRESRGRVAATEVYDADLHPEGVPSHFAVRVADGFAQGAVHDDNAFVMGGVAGHAGLFGTAEAVLEVAKAWLDADRGIAPGVRDRCWQRSAVLGSTRALGFDMLSADSARAMGLSDRAVGHTGYTGTSLWIDPPTRSIYVLLSNRVHPVRTDMRIKDLRVRFHAAASRLRP